MVVKKDVLLRATNIKKCFFEKVNLIIKIQIGRVFFFFVATKGQIGRVSFLFFDLQEFIVNPDI